MNTVGELQETRPEAVGEQLSYALEGKGLSFTLSEMGGHSGALSRHVT